MEDCRSRRRGDCVLLKDKQRFGELLAAEERISTNILAERLARLEAEGLITKSRDKTNRRQYVYAPTPKALDLLPALLEISIWSAKYDPKTAAPSALMRRIRVDRNGFIRELVARLTRQNAKT